MSTRLWLSPPFTALIAIATGCSNPPPPPTPAERFAAVETHLLDTEKVELGYRIESQGEFEVDVRGVLTIDGEAVEIGFQGTFDGQPKRGLFHGDASRMTLDTDEQDFERDSPKALREGIVLGLTRMGLLHNLFVLANGGAPEGTDGNARETFQVVEFEDDGDDAIRFVLLVEDQRSAVASLQIDPGTGLPLRRTQTVRFGEGRQMVVTEEYGAPGTGTLDTPSHERVSGD